MRKVGGFILTKRDLCHDFSFNSDKKGDLSKAIEEGLKYWLKKHE